LAKEPCVDCKKNGQCKEPCAELAKLLENYPDDPYLVFVQAPWEAAGFYEDRQFTSRVPDKDLMLTGIREAFRPLSGLTAQTALAYIGKHYFSMSHEDLGKVFKIKNRRVYAILQEAQRVVVGVQTCQASPEPGGDS